MCTVAFILPSAHTCMWASMDLYIDLQEEEEEEEEEEVMYLQSVRFGWNDRGL